MSLEIKEIKSKVDSFTKKIIKLENKFDEIKKKIF